MGASAGAEQTSGGLIAYAVLVAADNVLDGGQSGKRMSLAHPVAALPGSRREIRLLQGGDMYSHTKAHVSTSFPHVFGGSGEFCFHMFSECLSFSSTCAGLQDRSCLGFPVKGLLFFVLCNRHWFNKAPGPDPRGTEMGVIYLCV